MISRIILAVALCAALVRADVYMQNPRGSNNRLDEANRDRANGNRLFDSQNNNRGGYNVGSLYYYSGSMLPLEWTNQHSCGNENNNCDIIFQYMCQDWVRDGASTNRIPTNNNNCYNFHCDTDLEYGRHESHAWYTKCQHTERNKGLFTSNQNLNTNERDCRFTRQNPNGQRRGYECPEERDYYPYWRPTPWVDIAIMTNDTTRCPYYQRESQNVKGRWECKFEHSIYESLRTTQGNGFIPINEANCLIKGGNWTWVEPWNVEAPACTEAIHSRDNHLGNVWGGEHARYNWTVPNLPAALEPYREFCVMRIRYNISTIDYHDWDSSVFESDSKEVFWAANAMHNYNRSHATQNNVDPDEDPALVPIWQTYGIPYHDVEKSFTEASENAVDGSREYVLKNNPKVDMFGPHVETFSGNGLGDHTNKRVKLQLAINTNQFGRTFQDRSHTFAIRPMPKQTWDECGGVVHNLAVRGKRGNIVQTYPGVEYDFVPDRLVVAPGDCIHAQWTGSNTNPNNNDGQGKQGTDRSNMVLLKGPGWDEFHWLDKKIAAHPEQKEQLIEANRSMTDGMSRWGHWGRSYPEHLDIARLFPDRELSHRLALQDDPKMAGGTWKQLGGQYGGEMSELDDSGTYFDLGPRKVTQSVGHYYYLCTRNNNYSNRSQKGKLIVMESPVMTETVGWAGGRVGSEGHGVWATLPKGLLINQVKVNMRTMDSSMLTHGKNVKSAVAWAQMEPVNPENTNVFNDPSNTKWELRLRYDVGKLENPKLLQGDSLESPSFTELNAEWVTDANGQKWAVAWVDAPGSGRRRASSDNSAVYYVSAEKNIVPIIAGVVAGVVVIALIVATVAYFKTHPEKLASVRRRAYEVKRSFDSKV